MVPLTAMNRELAKFLASVDRTYAFPAGGNYEILLPAEESLVQAVEQLEMLPSEIMDQLSAGLESYRCYDLVILGCRLAVLGVRLRRVEKFRIGMLFVLAGLTEIDRRDAFRALAVIEYCANILRIECQQELLVMAQGSGDSDCHSLLQSYFLRTDDLRTIDVMGIYKVGEGDTLTFW